MNWEKLSSEDTSDFIAAVQDDARVLNIVNAVAKDDRRAADGAKMQAFRVELAHDREHGRAAV